VNNTNNSLCKLSIFDLVKSAYLKSALAWHPDKGAATEREVRTQKFQVISKIYELLKDEELRRSYDETGVCVG
jgi:DnaJ-class molecular chaperone